MELKDLKAQAYDLLAQKQQIDKALLEVNNAIGVKLEEENKKLEDKPETETTND